MKYTRFGLHVRAMGSNCESARRAGIKIVSNSFRIYLMMGALAGVAGIFDITRFATTNPSGHTTDGMMAIMAVVMGGTSMKGGIASVCGSMLAVLIPVTLQIGMIVLGINSFYQLIAIGIFLVIAVYVDYVPQHPHRQITKWCPGPCRGNRSGPGFCAKRNINK